MTMKATNGTPEHDLVETHPFDEPSDASTKSKPRRWSWHSTTSKTKSRTQSVGSGDFLESDSTTKRKTRALLRQIGGGSHVLFPKMKKQKINSEKEMIIAALVFKANKATKTGVKFIRKNGVVIVSGIVENGMFSETDLRIGDEVIRINDVECNGKTTKEVADLISETKGAVFLFARRKKCATISSTGEESTGELICNNVTANSVSTNSDSESSADPLEQSPGLTRSANKRKGFRESLRTLSFRESWKGSSFFRKKSFAGGTTKSVINSSIIDSPNPNISMSIHMAKEHGKKWVSMRSLRPKRKKNSGKKFGNGHIHEPKPRSVLLRITEERRFTCDDSSKAGNKEVQEVAMLNYPLSVHDTADKEDLREQRATSITVDRTQIPKAQEETPPVARVSSQNRTSDDAISCVTYDTAGLSRATQSTYHISEYDNSICEFTSHQSHVQPRYTPRAESHYEAIMSDLLLFGIDDDEEDDGWYN